MDRIMELVEEIGEIVKTRKGTQLSKKGLSLYIVVMPPKDRKEWEANINFWCEIFKLLCNKSLEVECTFYAPKDEKTQKEIEETESGEIIEDEKVEIIKIKGNVLFSDKDALENGWVSLCVTQKELDRLDRKLLRNGFLYAFHLYLPLKHPIRLYIPSGCILSTEINF